MKIKMCAGWIGMGLLLWALVPRSIEAAARWAVTMGGADYDYLVGARRTSDNGYMVAGTTGSYGAGNTDAWCAKLDASGTPVWQKTYGGTGIEETASMRLVDGGCILVGNIMAVPKRDLYCLRLDTLGNTVWARRISGAPSFYPSDVRPTSDGGYVIAGYADNPRDAWCLKLDATGNILWYKTYGGASVDDVYGLLPTSDGGLLLVGKTSSFGAGSYDGWCLKLDGSGNVGWQQTYGGAQGDYAGSVESTPDGGYILGGSADSFGAGLSDAWALKVGADGAIDPSCATLVQTPTAAVSTSNGLVASSSATTSSSSLTAADWNCTKGSSSAAATIQCSGGVSGPVITSMKSKTSKAGSAATIYGTGFSSDKKNDVVYFGTRKVKSITKAKATSLRLTIPKKVKGTVDVYVLVNGEKSNLFPFTVK